MNQEHWWFSTIPGTHDEPTTPECRVYLGSHGCQFDRGHEGDHECDCGLVFEPWSHMFGEDAPAKPDEGDEFLYGLYGLD